LHELLVAAVLGLIEGLTEFVPVSSTGHLIVVGHLLGFSGQKAATFEVVIQLGAILAVAVLFRQRLAGLATLKPGQGVSGRNGVLLLGLTTLPALVLGGIAHGAIKEVLFSPLTVAVGWAAGGVGLLAIERGRPAHENRGLDALGWRDALVIGCCQCLALWPGVSRSAATIAGAMMLGVGRKSAAEYSFLAASPLIAAAALYDLYANWHLLRTSDVPIFAVGFAISFLAAWMAVRWFLRLVATFTLRPFAWYRIGLALLLLAGLAIGQVTS
jgi:undecaprenyl-diphosphatase